MRPTLAWILLPLLLVSCRPFAFFHVWSLPEDAPSATESRKDPEGAAPAEGPERAYLVKMLSWAEDAPEGCEVDLEGTEPPAEFVLRYELAGRPRTMIESEVDRLFEEGWEIVNRSERGYGFEKAATFQWLDFDIAEELRCQCDGKAGEAESRHLIRLGLDWKRGERPEARGQIGDAVVEPVVTNGRLVVYDFRFTGAAPEPYTGSCSSRFAGTIELSSPIE